MDEKHMRQLAIYGRDGILTKEMLDDAFEKTVNEPRDYLASAMDHIDFLNRENAELKRKLAVAKKALEFYAYEWNSNTEQPPTHEEVETEFFDRDGGAYIGAHAVIALKDIE